LLSFRKISLVSLTTSTTELSTGIHSGSILRAHMPELDAVRGIAVVMVLFLHGMVRPLNAALSRPGEFLLSISQYGGVGVDLFFVLSGFLITGILIDSRNEPDYYRRFYARRASRILPALLGMLLLLLLSGSISWSFLLVSLMFLANSSMLLGVPLEYGPLWSLAVEEHFYILWPACIRKLSSRCQLWLMISIVVLSPLLRAMAFAWARGAQSGRPLYTWFNLDGLALGAALAIWLRRPAFRRPHLARTAVPLLVIGVATFVSVLDGPMASAALFQTACAVASAGLISCMLLMGTSRWRILVDRPVLKFLGFISYGLYLLHVWAFRMAEILLAHVFPILVAAGRPTAAMLLRFAAGSGLAIALAFLSRQLLEQAFLQRFRGHRTAAQ
jgi:peptidoglycan/LPS O-acetylase OafA/YrhL